MTKSEMLKEMDERNWSHGLTMEDSYKDIKDEFNEMQDELSCESDMFPNGRDYDAEDEDGI